MDFGFRGCDQKILGKTDESMSVGQIAIQRQRLLAFSNAWTARFVNIWTTPRNTWAKAWSGARDRALIKAASAAANRAARSSVKKADAQYASTCAMPTSASILSRIERQGTFEKAARLRHVFGGQPLVQRKPCLGNTSPSHRDAVSAPLAAPRPQ